MSRRSVQVTASWVLMVGFVVLGLMYLNGAFFSAWVAGGPPNPHPLGWERRALGQLAFSLASFTLAVGSFMLVQALPVWKRSWVILVLAGIVLAVSPYVGRLVLQDKCLDRGGQWSNLTLECEPK
jgi:hypothetical protein